MRSGHEGPLVELDPRVAGLAPSATLRIRERCTALRAAGRRIFDFGLGQSPFPVPEELVAALREHAPVKDYLPVRGLPALREAVVEFHARRQGLTFRPEHVVVGPGSKELLFLLQLAFRGDVLVPTPSWVSYEPQSRLASRRFLPVPTSRDDGWRLHPEQLDRACVAAGEGPKLLVLTYPNNPTGTTLGAERLAALADVARRHRLVIVSDEIYGELTFDDRHRSIARAYPEGTIVAGGVSKWCGAGGWRLGVLAVPAGLSPLVDAVGAVASETFTSTSAPVQHAAVAAFRGSPAIDAYLSTARRILGALGAAAAARLREAGAVVPEPEGGFYVMPDFEPRRAALAARGITTSPALAEALLEEAGVACLPGVDFGQPASELTVRLSLVDFAGGLAMQLAKQHEGPLDDAWLGRACGGVLAGIAAIAAWVGRA